MSQRIVIVGGVAGGATAAAKARRDDETARITVFERGPYVSFANCGLPYYIGREIDQRNRLLLMTPESFYEKYRIDVQVGCDVLRIDREARQVLVRCADGRERAEPYDRLILSQGAEPLRPPIEGIEQEQVFTLRSIPDMDRIDAFLDERQPRHAVVLGGGFIGLEMAEAFHLRGLSVQVVERAPHILPMLDDDIAAELSAGLDRDAFTINAAAGVVAIGTDWVRLDDGRELPADLVLVSAGVRPEVTLAKEAGLRIGATGAVQVNARLETSDPRIAAIGDAAEVTHRITGGRTRIPLAGPANRQGRIAGANAVGGHLTYGGAQGTAIVRIFESVVGSTGLSTRQAEEAGFSVVTSMTRDANHAGYYPGAEMVISKLIIDGASGRLLGAQVLGHDGVDKRLDVYATAIYAGLTVDNLGELDLAYAPPFGSANDPVNQAGFTAGHLLRGEVRSLQRPDELPADAVLLDVRNPDELQRFGTLVGAINIPLPKLRDGLQEIPRDRTVVIFCQKGQRGYLATRILAAHGFDDVRNIAGGYLQAMHGGWPTTAAAVEQA